MGNPSEATVLIEGALAKRRCSKMSVLTVSPCKEATEMSRKSFDVCRSVLTSLVMQGKSWDLRWCVLTSSSLTYYRSLEDRDWGGAGTVLSLSSLKRFESISSLVFQVHSCRLRK
jgi:hypothetical protein